MNIGRVEGTVVCTVKTGSLDGLKLMVVRQIVNGQEKGLVIAADATRQAGRGDVVMILGKGHESGQEFAHETVPFDDRLVAREALLDLQGRTG